MRARDNLERFTRYISHKVVDFCLRRELSPTVQKVLGVVILLIGILSVAAVIWGIREAIVAKSISEIGQAAWIVAMFVAFFLSTLFIFVPALGTCLHLFRYKKIEPVQQQEGEL